MDFNRGETKIISFVDIHRINILPTVITLKESFHLSLQRRIFLLPLSGIGFATVVMGEEIEEIIGETVSSGTISRGGREMTKSDLLRGDDSGDLGSMEIVSSSSMTWGVIRIDTTRKLDF